MKCKLSDVVEFNPRESIKKGFCAKKISMDKLQPYVRDIPEFEYAEFSGGAKFRNGDTIMARITPCLENGKIAKVNVLDSGEVGFGSTEFIVLRAKPEIMDENYLYYLVCSPTIRDQAIKSMVGSSGRQRVQIDVVKNIEIELPDFNTQQKIGCLLKEIDDKIAINTKINNHLAPHLCEAQIAAVKRRGQIPQPDGCLHTDGKVSDRGSNAETAEQFSSRQAA